MAIIRRRIRGRSSGSGSHSLITPWLPVAALVGVIALVYVAKNPITGLNEFIGSANAETAAGQARVIDGDTIEIGDKRYRLLGIDAPESEQTCTSLGVAYPCGREASKALNTVIGGADVTCEARDRDRYNRVVAVCHAGGHNLNGWMVGQGWALAYRRFSTDYVAHEKSAAAGKRGIWKGEFIAPWEWRRGQRLKPLNESKKEDCQIKGNISQSGARIYHVPGGQYYRRTKINEAKGERFFCSEEEARSAGWRRSKR